MGRATIRNLLTIVVDVLIFVAVVLAVRQVVVFSAQIMSHDWAQTFNAFASHLVLPLGIPPVRTPYGGVFDVNNALTIVIVLGLEWVLSGVRDRA